MKKQAVYADNSMFTWRKFTQKVSKKDNDICDEFYDVSNSLEEVKFHVEWVAGFYAKTEKERVKKERLLLKELDKLIFNYCINYLSDDSDIEFEIPCNSQFKYVKELQKRVVGRLKEGIKNSLDRADTFWELEILAKDTVVNINKSLLLERE